jgi:hypothetical protein
MRRKRESAILWHRNGVAAIKKSSAYRHRLAAAYNEKA